ncbi:MAG: hypothetical protein OXP71_13225 [Candidatus Poribacteria bacterium]|nr:hypothetical protein [Candidatus Poribacteria bacterium]
MNVPFEARPNIEAIATREGFASVFADIEGDPVYAEQLHKDADLPNPFTYSRNRTYKLCDGVGILSISVTPGNLLVWGTMQKNTPVLPLCLTVPTISSRVTIQFEGLQHRREFNVVRIVLAQQLKKCPG